MCVSLLADTAPQHSMAGFALVMAASLAVYLQLMASLSKPLPLTVSGQQGYCCVCVCVCVRPQAGVPCRQDGCTVQWQLCRGRSGPLQKEDTA